MALLGKQLGVAPAGWREAAGAFGAAGTYCSVADIYDEDSLARVRAYKQQLKAAAGKNAGENASRRGQETRAQAASASPGRKVTEQGEAMPLFGKNPADAGASWEPQAADSRLGQTAGAEPGGVFTSDLSVSEYVLLGEAGFEPLGFSWSATSISATSACRWCRWSQKQELQVLSQATDLAQAHLHHSAWTSDATAKPARLTHGGLGLDGRRHASRGLSPIRGGPVPVPGGCRRNGEMVDDPYDLHRFVDAQDAGGSYQRAVAELRGGRKQSHWMWFVFPQVAGLGQSPASRRFAISSLEEARGLLRHPVLGPRLAESTGILGQLPDRDANQIFGGLDAQNFRSSMTLFLRAAPHRPRSKGFSGSTSAGVPRSGHGPATGERQERTRLSRSWRWERIGSASSIAVNAAGQSAGPYPAPRSQWCSSTSTSRQVSSWVAGKGAESSIRTGNCQASSVSWRAMARRAMAEQARSDTRSFPVLVAPCSMAASRASALG